MLGGSRQSGSSRYRVLMGIASALWLIAAMRSSIFGAMVTGTKSIIEKAGVAGEPAACQLS